LAAILLGVIAALLLFINIPPGHSLISNSLSDHLGRKVKFNGHIYPVFAWPPTFYVSKLTIANHESGRAEKLANIGEMKIGVAFVPLLRGDIQMQTLSLIDSALNLEVDADDNINWDLWGGDEKFPKETNRDLPPLHYLYLRNSTLTYFDVPLKTDITLTAESEQENFLLKGTGIHLGKEFSLEAKIGYSLKQQQANAMPVDTTVTVGHTTLHAQGTIRDPQDFKGINVMLDVKGADASELFPLFGIALPPTAAYTLRGHLDYQNNQWRFRDFAGKMGQSDLSGNLLWDTSGPRPKLTAEFISQNLRFTDLGPLIGVAPTQPVSEKQKEKAVEQQVSPYVIPDVPLDITKLSVMDADVSFTGKHVISSNLPLDDFYMKAILDDRLLTLTPVKFGTANGDIVANMIINARLDPVEDKAEIELHRLSLARLMEGLGRNIAQMKEAEGYIGGTIKLTGSGKSLYEMLASSNGVVGIGMEGGEISNLIVELIGLDIAESLGFFLTGDRVIPIRCIVADFKVERGVMATEIFVVDTEDTNIKGTGTINFGGEKLNLRLNPQPKDVSLLAARSPILVTGTLKKPSVTIEPTTLAARGSIAGALAAVIPIAALLAFIEPGLGKDSNCAQLIHELDKDIGETRATDQLPEN